MIDNFNDLNLNIFVCGLTWLLNESVLQHTNMVDGLIIWLRKKIILKSFERPSFSVAFRLIKVCTYSLISQNLCQFRIYIYILRFVKVTQRCPGFTEYKLSISGNTQFDNTQVEYLVTYSTWVDQADKSLPLVYL